MVHEVEWQIRAIKQLRKLPADAQKRINKSVSRLQTEESGWTNVRALINHEYTHRLRVGDYRVLFNSFETVEIVMIEEVKKRDEKTY